MTDIRLDVKGDASEAKRALDDVAASTKKVADAHHDQLVQQQKDYLDAKKASEEMWGSVAKYAAAAATAVTAFGVSAVKAFSEADRVSRQLTRAAGEYAEVLSQQASALQDVFAVDDDIIKQSQVLLTQWGGVGAASEDVTRAILDYAAATGQNAVSATESLIRNVETGGKALEKIGVHFESTGDRATDLTAAVAALNEKFGGAAAADANSLHGNIEALGLAFEEFQEHVGGAISKFNEQYQITNKLTEALKGLDTFLFGNERDERDQEYLGQLEQLSGRIEHRKVLAQDLAAAEKAGRADAVADTERMINSNEKAIGQLREMLALRSNAIAGGLPVAEDGRTKSGRQSDTEVAKAAETHAKAMADLREQNIADMREYQRGLDELDEHARQRDEETYADELKRSADSVAADIKTANERTKVRAEMLAKIEQDTAEHNEKMAKLEAEAAAKASKEAADRVKQQEEKWKRAADQIGAAFVNALADQLSKLAQGGEFDAALFVGEVLAAAVGTAATVIGTAYGAPAVGAAIGNLAAMGIRAGASGISAQNRRSTRTYHDGGWPRAHDGAWMGADEVPIIAQTGERVLSRREVGRMGGASQVDAMARGGAARVVVNLQAIDSKSAAESFESDLGKGLRRAMRTGRGDVPALLGMGPR